MLFSIRGMPALASLAAGLAGAAAVLLGASQPVGGATPARLQDNGAAAHVNSSPAAAGTVANVTTGKLDVVLTGVDDADRMASTDWGRALAESTMRRHPDAAQHPWKYHNALFLYGIYLVHRRTGDDRYLRYVKDWADAHVDDNGNMFVDERRRTPVTLNSLDNLMPGRLLLVLYQATKQEKYKLAAKKIRARFSTWPRTADGGLWHTTASTGKLWADGTYMALPFLVQYGATVGDSRYAYNEAASQLLIYARHLKDRRTGLLYHAYDEQGRAPWADPRTRHSPEFWCRGIGWYAMALVEVLEALPPSHVRRPELLSLLRDLVAAFEMHQDPRTGRWFQVVDKGSLRGNWVETSCSSMYTYVISKAVGRGYVPKSYEGVASRGYRGVLDAISLGSGSQVILDEICTGTVVGDLAYYLARPRGRNNPHGVGAFLIMHEQMNNRAR